MATTIEQEQPHEIEAIKNIAADDTKKHFDSNKPIYIFHEQENNYETGDILCHNDAKGECKEETTSISIKEINENEPMLKPDLRRFTVFPIMRHDLWNAYKNHENALWTVEELDFSSDKAEWLLLSQNEKYFIEHVLAFFAGSDGIVMENINKNFANEVQWPEARAFYATQNYIENIHSQTYSMLIETYIDDKDRKEELFRAIETIPCVKKKAEWAMKWMDPEKSTFAERLVAFAVVEGVFFSGSFCSIFWLKSRGIMVSGLGKSNELIARDENLHCMFAILLYTYLENKLTKERIYEIFKEAVEIEIEFITQSIPCKLVGMNSVSMIRYIKYVANYWVTKFVTNTGKHCPAMYHVKNPFSFMDMNGLDGKTNFFEQVNTEYQRHNKSKAHVSKVFEGLDDDF